jgi:hypothetical protein
MSREVLNSEESLELLKQSLVGPASSVATSKEVSAPTERHNSSELSSSSESKSKETVSETHEQLTKLNREGNTTTNTPFSDDIDFGDDALGPLKNTQLDSRYKPLEFADPAEMLTFFDRNLQEGIISWYPWQLEANEFIASGIDPVTGEKHHFTKREPLKFLVVGCNGSGKDAYINAPLAVWHCLCKVRSRCIITSASYSQLESQTQNYIRTLCFSINNWCREAGIVGEEEQDIFLVKKDHIVCSLTHSEIKMFVTDDPGRAEGFHPFPDYPQGELMILINEGKTVKDNIFEALSRCTFNRWIEISSSGEAAGHFYNSFRNSRDWRDGYRKFEYFSRVVTSYDCLSHKAMETIEADKREYGENSFIFRSKHLSLFTSVDSQVVVTRDQWQKCINFPPDVRKFKNIPRRAGLDLAKGGDENALYIIEGNKVEGYEAFKATDIAEVTCPVLIKMFEKWELKRSISEIYADDGGVGSATIDLLKKDGWNVVRVMNQWGALNKTGMYANRGAENYFRVARLIQENLINLEAVKQDNRLMSQMTSRYYKQHDTNGKIVLESKKDARAKGHGSPDRADALVLAFSGLSIGDYTDDLHEKLIVEAKTNTANSQEALAKMMDQRREMNRLHALRIPQTGNYNNPGHILRSLYENN